MMTNLMTILERKAFISSNPRIVLSSCPPPCGHFSIQESATGGLSYKAKKLPEVIPGAESFEHNVHSDMLYYLYIKSVKLFDDRYNSTRTYSTSAFTDSETKSLLHSYWMDQFNSHFYVIARHTHFSTSW